MTIRLLLLDLQEGFRANRHLYALSGIYILALVLSLPLSARATGSQTPSNLGNLLACSLMGMGRFLPSPREPFRLPVAWMILVLLPCYITLLYPYRDLQGFGQKVLVAGGSRWSWWLGKCAWTITSVLLYWLLFFALHLAAALIDGGGMGLNVSASIQRVTQVDLLLELREESFVPFLVLVPYVTVAICLLQLFMSLVMGPTLSFIVIFSLLFVSAFYYRSPLLLGNYLMAARSVALTPEGLSFWQGFVIATATSLVTTAGGGLLFSKKDIYGRSE